MRRNIANKLLKFMRPGRVAAFASLVEAEKFTPGDLAASERQGVTDLLRHACMRIPFYVDFCQEAGLDPEGVSFSDLPRFPLQTKSILMEQVAKFQDPQVPPRDLVPNYTGGSSGTPFRFFSDRRALEERKGNDMRGRTWTGWRPGDRQAILWAHPRDNAAVRSLRNRLLAAWVHRTRTLNAYDMDGPRMDAFYEELRAFGPVLLLGFASSLAFFSEYLTRAGKSPLPLKGILSSAESLTPEHRAVIEGFFGSPVFNRYGSREFGVMAQQCERMGGLHVFNDQVHLEILRPDGVPCAPGEVGEVVVTDLLNRAMPFIRYRTGDLASWSRETCPCGRPFPILASVSGRTSEILVGKNGKFYSCLGPRFFGPDIPGVQQMQVIQESLDRIVVKVVTGAGWSPVEGGRVLTRRLVELLGQVEVEVLPVEEIPVTASGKYRFTISRVSPFS